MHYNSDPGVVLYYTGLMFPDACIAFCFCFFIYNFFLHILLALVTSKLETWFETSLCNACCRHSANFLHLKYYTLTLMLFDSWNNKQLKTLLPRSHGNLKKVCYEALHYCVYLLSKLPSEWRSKIKFEIGFNEFQYT